MPRRSFREILRKGRRDLHDHLKVPALYIAFPGAEPLAVDVRDFTRITNSGDQGSRTKGYAEMAEVTPRILFFREQLADARYGAIFSIAPGEAYRVERTEPSNDLTRTADVTPLSAAEADGLPIPVGASSFDPKAASHSYLVANTTGQATYTHSGTPQVLVSGVPVPVANDNAFTNETQLPVDVASFYDGEFVRSGNGDGLLISLSISFTPSTAEASDLTLWLQVPGDAERRHERNVPLPFGSEQKHIIAQDFVAVVDSTWAQNGARIFAECDGPGSITAVSFLISRIHRGGSV